jgi:hypothetical protein
MYWAGEGGVAGGYHRWVNNSNSAELMRLEPGVGLSISCGGTQTGLQKPTLVFAGGGSIGGDAAWIYPSVGIYMFASAYQMWWPNGSYINGDAGYVQGSREDLKEDLSVLPDETLLEQVRDPNMPVLTYRFKDSEDRRMNVGFTVESIDRVMPAYVVRNARGEPAGYVPQELTAILWGAVRGLDASSLLFQTETLDHLAQIDEHLASLDAHTGHGQGGGNNP